MSADLSLPTSFIERFALAPTASGVLSDLSFAVKDVFDIQGHQTSFGNNVWASTHPVATRHADSIATLLKAGATCKGKTVLGEFCCGIEGKNFDYGMPINPANPELVPGGSSSGSAAVVGSGEVDFALGTDMAGSIRIPASYCGLYGMRPTHNAISMAGCLSLAPSLDTVGVISRSLAVLEKAMQVLLIDKQLPDTSDNFKQLLLLDDLLAQSSTEIREAVQVFSKKLSQQLGLKIIHTSTHALFADNRLSLSETLRCLLCGEIWEALEPWLKQHPLKYGKTTTVDFSPMKTISPALLKDVRLKQRLYADKLDQALKNTLICIPTHRLPPRKRQVVLNEKNKAVNVFDYERLRPFVALSSIGKLPQLTIPVSYQTEIPISVSMLSARHTDLDLLKSVKSFL